MEQPNRKRTKRQHILPRSYLKRFSHSEQVWVHNFQTKTSYINNIKDAACIDDFYTVQTHNEKQDDIIESGLLAKIEEIGNPIIEKMTTEMSIPEGDEKALFCYYLAMMFTRGLWFRQILSEVYEHFANEIASKLVSDENLFNSTMDKIKKDIGFNHGFTFEQAKEIHEKSDISMHIPRTYFVKEMMLYAAPMVDVFYNMNFNLIFAQPLNDKFITADKPIVTTSSNQTEMKCQTWLQYPDVILYFPLSSRTCLMLNKQKKPRILSVNRRKVALINGLMSNDCVYITISEDKQFSWLRQNQTISHSIDEIFELFTKEKTEIPRVNQVLGKRLNTRSHNKINKLKGNDN